MTSKVSPCKPCFSRRFLGGLASGADLCEDFLLISSWDASLSGGFFKYFVRISVKDP